MTFELAYRMVGAEILKLRRNRGLMAFTGLLSVGTVVIFMGYLQIRHASIRRTTAPRVGWMDSPIF